MKTSIITILLVVFYFMQSKAQWVNIPDANFVVFLDINYPSCMNSNNQLNTSCDLIMNATSVDCSEYSIADLTGIQYFINLKTLDCTNNALTGLPPLPSTLTILSCGGNMITGLPSLPGSLVELSCGYNSLTSLPSLPSSLTELTCYYSKLKSLPSLPSSLLILDCAANQITNLPSLPSSLITLNCGKNMLTGLPSLPGSLTSLGCANNQLGSLPPLPATLTELDCEYNSLTALPSLPPSLFSLTCAYNQLTYLPSIPDSMGGLFIEGNPHLTCLPYLGKIDEFIFDSTGITCLPDSGKILNYFPDITELPICDSAFERTCGLFYASGIQSVTANPLTIYPNPAENEVFLSGNFTPKEIEVTNLLGVTVLEQYLQAGAETNSINIAGLTPGIYFVTLYSGNQTLIRKLIKD